MNALELLKTDHQTVNELLKKAEGTKNEKQQRQLFDQIKAELETHAHIEETIFLSGCSKKRGIERPGA